MDAVDLEGCYIRNMFAVLAKIAQPEAPVVPWDGEISYAQATTEPNSANV